MTADWLSRVEAACARALAGDHDKRSLVATLRLVIERTQEMRAALGKPTVPGPDLREAYRAMRMADDAHWGEFCGCCGVLLSLEARDEDCGQAHTAAQLIHAWLEKNPEPTP